MKDYLFRTNLVAMWKITEISCLLVITLKVIKKRLKKSLGIYEFMNELPGRDSNLRPID